MMKYHLPETNLFFIKDNLYPNPINSKSIPDVVAPSPINWNAAILGLDGPSETSNLARKHPLGPSSPTDDISFSFHITRLFSGFLKHKSPMTMLGKKEKYNLLNIYNQL